MLNLLLILTSVSSLVIADEVYENSSHICQRCLCTYIDDFVLNCSNKTFQNVPANWPEHNRTLTATFSFNNITTLKILPFSKQKAKLIFDHCNIKYLDEGVFSNVPNVEFIDLSYNLLTTEEIDGQDFKGPYNNSQFHPIAVKHLNLAHNQIHSIPRKLFENMPHLEELNLAGNDLHVLDINTQIALSTLTKLKVLNLSGNELTELIDDAVEKLHNLEILDLSSNELDFVPNTLEYLKRNLKVLHLSNNYIFHLDDKSFIGLDLQELYLDNLPQLEYVKANTFTRLKKLKKLSLSNNILLKEIDVEAFDKGQKLNELHLNNNSLTDIKYHMLEWSNLKILKLEDNSLECTCDLYNISRALNRIITRNVEAPQCIDLIDGGTRSIYQLEEDTCHFERSSYHVSHATRRFEYIRMVIISLSTVFSIGGVIVIVLGYLRHRRGVAFRNYKFSAQVSYFPVTSQ